MPSLLIVTKLMRGGLAVAYGVSVVVVEVSVLSVEQEEVFVVLKVKKEKVEEEEVSVVLVRKEKVEEVVSVLAWR